MNRNNVRKVVFGAAFATMMLVSAQAFASTAATSSVTMSASSDNLALTVPTTIATAVAADGTITGPSADTCKITNTSVFAVRVSQIQASGGSGFNLTTKTAYDTATAADSYWMTLTPNSGTALDLGSYTTAAAPAVATDWNLAATSGSIGISSAGKIKSVDKDLSTATSAASINWTFIAGSAS